MDPDYRVTLADVQQWETKYGQIPDGAVVIMNSGWTYKYPNRTLVFGTEMHDNVSSFHFPGWHEDTVEWLVQNRKIHVLGVDTPSTDYGQAAAFPVHVILGSNQVSGLENVANLNSVPESGTTITAAVFKLYDGSGGPTRVFATMPSDDVSSANCLNSLNALSLVALSLALTLSRF